MRSQYTGVIVMRAELIPNAIRPQTIKFFLCPMASPTLLRGMRLRIKPSVYERLTSETSEIPTLNVSAIRGRAIVTAFASIAAKLSASARPIRRRMRLR
jgi:hypothetical protein